MTGNMLPGRRSLVSNGIERMDVYWYGDNLMNPQTMHRGGCSVMVWGVCSWSDMGPLMRLDTTLIAVTYVNILSDHLHPFM